ncbi:hypothetical protein Dimus_010279, partial [Dionaea muscipula]
PMTSTTSSRPPAGGFHHQWTMSTTTSLPWPSSSASSRAAAMAVAATKPSPSSRRHHRCPDLQYESEGDGREKVKLCPATMKLCSVTMEIEEAASSAPPQPSMVSAVGRLGSGRGWARRRLVVLVFDSWSSMAMSLSSCSVTGRRW